MSHESNTGLWFPQLLLFEVVSPYDKTGVSKILQDQSVNSAAAAQSPSTFTVCVPANNQNKQ